MRTGSAFPVTITASNIVGMKPLSERDENIKPL